MSVRCGPCRVGRKELIVPTAELPEAPPAERGKQIPDDSPVMPLALARA